MGKYWLLAVVVSMLMSVKNDNAVAGKQGETQVIDQQIIDLMKTLDTLNERSRMRLLSQVDEQRNELLGILLKHLGTSSSRNVQAAAIYLIGRHRLADGVGELIKLIDFDPGRQPQPGPEPLWEQYPAMEALITIGKPSVSAAVELLATDPNDLRRSLAVKVVRYVEGADVAEFIFQKAQAATQDATRKALLQDAVLRLQKLVRETR